MTPHPSGELSLIVTTVDTAIADALAITVGRLSCPS